MLLHESSIRCRRLFVVNPPVVEEKCRWCSLLLIMADDKRLLIDQQQKNSCDHESLKKKPTSFQITSVTVQGSRLSTDGGDDSADDLDESHTEDLSLDCSRTTDVDNDPLSEDSSTANNKLVTTTREQQSSQTPPVVQVAVVSTATDSEQTAKPPAIPDQWQSRFKVVKIVSSQPFKRGRWICMDFLDPPSTTQSSESKQEVTESSPVSSVATSCIDNPITVSSNIPNIGGMAHVYEIKPNESYPGGVSVTISPQPTQQPFYGIFLPLNNQQFSPEVTMLNAAFAQDPNLRIDGNAQAVHQSVIITNHPSSHMTTQNIQQQSNIQQQQQQPKSYMPSNNTNGRMYDETNQSYASQPPAQVSNVPTQQISVPQHVSQIQVMSVSGQDTPPVVQVTQQPPILSNAVPPVANVSNVPQQPQMTTSVASSQQPQVVNASVAQQQPQVVNVSVAQQPQMVSVASGSVAQQQQQQPQLISTAPSASVKIAQQQPPPLSTAPPPASASVSVSQQPQMVASAPAPQQQQQMISTAPGANVTVTQHQHQQHQMMASAPVAQQPQMMGAPVASVAATQQPQMMTSAAQVISNISVPQQMMTTAPVATMVSAQPQLVNAVPEHMVPAATIAAHQMPPGTQQQNQAGIPITQSVQSMPTASLSQQQHPAVSSSPPQVITSGATMAPVAAAVTAPPTTVVAPPVTVQQQPPQPHIPDASQPSNVSIPTNVASQCLHNHVDASLNVPSQSVAAVQPPQAEAASDVSSKPSSSEEIITESAPGGGSTVAIDNKIEQAMDLVKSHLMFAVREEVDVLKEKISELMEKISLLEYENSFLRANATQETLSQLTQSQQQQLQQQQQQQQQTQSNVATVQAVAAAAAIQQQNVQQQQSQPQQQPLL